MGHAQAILGSRSLGAARQRATDRRQALSVRASEDLGRPGAAPVPPSPERARARQDPHLQGVADALRQRLQTRVRVKGSAERGRVEIEYFGAEDFDRITGVLLGDG